MQQTLIPTTKFASVQVIQNNVFTSVRHQFTALELDVISCMLYKLKEKGFKETTIIIPLAMLEKYKDGKVRRWHLEQAMERLMKRQGKIIDTDAKGQSSFTMIQFVSAVHIPKGEGIMYIEVPKASMKYYAPLEKNFTIYQLEQSLSFRSKYTKRIYQILSQYKNMGAITFKLTELKEVLGLIDTTTGVEKLVDFNTFSKKVLEVAKLELQECNSDIQFSYEVASKDRKKVTGIKFTIAYAVERAIKTQRDNPLFTRLVNAFSVTEYQANEIILTINEDNITALLAVIYEDHRDGKVKNIGAYTAQAFKNNYTLGYRVG